MTDFRVRGTHAAATDSRANRCRRSTRLPTDITFRDPRKTHRRSKRGVGRVALHGMTGD